MIDYAGPATVTHNGRPMAECEQVSIKRQTNAKAVKTLAKGLAGRTKGAPEYSITLRNAVPATGFEVAYNDLIESQELFQIGIRKAGIEEVFEVWVEDSEDGSEVDAPQSQGVTLHGRLVTSHAV
jgi:hypothetical protein